MPKEHVPFQVLREYLPEESFDDVLQYLLHHKVHLTVTRERKTVLGDYRHALHGKNHRISVNGNLNKYAFLITLLHELAHLFTYERYGHRVQPHGVEWKSAFGKILEQFLTKEIFPPDISQTLKKTLHNPAASSCSDEALLRVLKKYDGHTSGLLLVEDLLPNSVFQLSDGRIFKLGPRLRKRFKCTELATGKQYLFSPVFEVMPIA